MNEDFFFYGFFALVAIMSAAGSWLLVVRPRVVPPAAGPAAGPSAPGPAPAPAAAPPAPTPTARRQQWLLPFGALLGIGLMVAVGFFWFEQLLTFATDKPWALLLGLVLALVFLFGAVRWAQMKHSNVTAYVFILVIVILCIIGTPYYLSLLVLGQTRTNNIIAVVHAEILRQFDEIVQTERLPNGEVRHTINWAELPDLGNGREEVQNARATIPAIDPLCKDAVTGQLLGDCEVFQLRTGQSITRVATLRHCLGYFPAEGVVVTSTGHDQYSFEAAGESESRFAVYSIPVGQTANEFFCPPG